MDNHKKELEIIADLMETLIEEMEYGEEDFDARLGKVKPKPEMAAISVETVLPEEAKDEDLEHDLDDDDKEEEEESFEDRLRRIKE